jgi:hypothetical protein
LFHHGLPDRSQLLTADGRAWLARVELPAVARQAVALALRMIDHLDTELDLLDTELARIASARAAASRRGVTPAGRARRHKKRERCRPLLPRRQIRSIPADWPAARASSLSEVGLWR